MRKSALFLLLLLLGATPSFAQMEDRGGPGDFSTPPGTDSDPFGTPPSTAPDPGDRGGLDPCPPGSTAPDVNPGDRGGLGEPGTPGDRQLEQRELPPGSVPPNPPGSVPSDPPGSLPSNPPGSIPPNPQGSVPGDQGGSFGQPDPGNQDQFGQDQFGMTDCPPGTDRGGGLDQRDGLGGQPGQDIPGSERETPPPLLPPAGGVQ